MLSVMSSITEVTRLPSAARSCWGEPGIEGDRAVASSTRLDLSTPTDAGFVAVSRVGVLGADRDTVLLRRGLASYERKPDSNVCFRSLGVVARRTDACVVTLDKSRDGVLGVDADLGVPDTSAAGENDATTLG
jgi:hypothetical protein